MKVVVGVAVLDIVVVVRVVMVVIVIAVVVGASLVTELKPVLPKTVAHLNANFFRICVCVSKIRLQLGISPLRKQSHRFSTAYCMPFSLVVEVVPQLHTRPSQVYQLKQ